METRESYDNLFQEAQAPTAPEPRQAMSKEEWAALQKEQREALYAQADAMADRVLGESERLKAYLQAQARLGRASVTNTLLLMEQRPGASRVHSFQEWQRMGRSVNRNEKASLVLEPGREYVKDDGSLGVSYNVKRVFDVKQTGGRDLRQAPIHPVRNRLKALMTKTPVPVQLSDAVAPGVGAIYSEYKNVVEVARGLEGDTLFFVVARELARAETRNSTFACDCVANILCNRYGISPRYSDRVPEEYANLEPRGKREMLSDVRQTACNAIERIDRNLEQMLSPQQKKQDAPTR